MSDRSEFPDHKGSSRQHCDAESGGKPRENLISAANDKLPCACYKRNEPEKDDQADNAENDHQLFLCAGKPAVASLGAFANDAQHPVSDETHKAKQENAAECLKQSRDPCFGGRPQPSMALRAVNRSGFGVVPAFEAVTLFGRPSLFHISEKYNTRKPETVGHI